MPPKKAKPEQSEPAKPVQAKPAGRSLPPTARTRSGARVHKPMRPLPWQVPEGHKL